MQERICSMNDPYVSPPSTTELSCDIVGCGCEDEVLKCLKEGCEATGELGALTRRMGR